VEGRLLPLSAPQPAALVPVEDAVAAATASSSSSASWLLPLLLSNTLRWCYRAPSTNPL